MELSLCSPRCSEEIPQVGEEVVGALLMKPVARVLVDDGPVRFETRGPPISLGEDGAKALGPRAL